MVLGKSVYLFLCMIRPQCQDMEPCARMAAYLQVFLISVLGKEKQYISVSTALFAEKNSPYPPVAVIGMFSLTYSFQPPCGPGIDSASNRN